MLSEHRHCNYNDSVFVATPSSRTIFTKLQPRVLPDAEHLEWQDRRDSQQWSSGQGSGQPSPFLHLLLLQRLTALGFQTEQNSQLAELLGHAAEPNILLDWHSCLQNTHSALLELLICKLLGQYRPPQSVKATQKYKLNKILSTYAMARTLLSIYWCSKIIPLFSKNKKRGCSGVKHHLQHTTEADKTDRLMYICCRESRSGKWLEVFL